METVKGFAWMIALWMYFKAAFAMGFGLLWSGGALIALAVLWFSLKKLAGMVTAKG
ncbi:MAG: hypothetical protein ACK4NZ_01280 [Tsuneonella sp.]